MIALLLCLAAPAAPTPSEGTDVIRTYSLDLAAPRWEESSGWEPFLPGAVPTDELEDDFDGGQDGDALADLLLGYFEDELSYEGRAVRYDRAGLSLRAPAAVHEGVAGALGFLEETVGATVALRVDLCELDELAFDDAATGHVPAAVADALVARARAAGHHERHVLRVAPGRAARLDASREQMLVRRYWIETAQETSAFDPDAHPVAVGPRIVVRAAPGPGGVHLVLALRRTAQVGPVRSVAESMQSAIHADTGAEFFEYASRYQVLDVANTSVATATFLADGEALVLRHDAALRTMGGTRLAVVRVEGGSLPTGGSVQVGDHVLDVFNGETLAPPRFADEPSFRHGAPRGLQRALTLDGPSDEPGRLGANVWIHGGDVEEAIDFAQSAGLLPEYDDAQVHGAWFLGRRTGGSGGEPIERLEALAPAPERAVVRATLRRRLDGRSEIVARVALSTLLGRPALAVCGGETAILSDRDVEVAQGSSGASPRVDPVFDGLVLQVVPRRSLGGRWSLAVQARAHVLEEPIAEFDTGGKLSGRLQQARHRNLVVDERVLFPRGAPPRLVIGDPEATVPGALSLEIVVSD